MKSIKSMVFGIAMCIAASFAYSAAEKQEIQFLPYYDSLNDKVGQPGHWFVRDAAGTTTGQHGDPTVRKGWAIYTWNQRAKNNRPGWTKICEEESLDSSSSEQLYLKYVTKEQFSAVMQTVSNDFVKVSKYNTDMAGVNSSIKTLDLRTQGLVTKVRDLTSTVSNVSEAADTALARADAAIEGIAAHETWAKAMSNNVLTAANHYTDEATNAIAKATRSNEYSSYEVWPHASDNNLTERFYIRTTVAELRTVQCTNGTIDVAVPKASNNCYVDWGDGEKTYLRDLPDFSKLTTNLVSKLYRKDEWLSGQDWVAYVVMEHTYEASDEKKYIVKVGGNDFFCIYKKTLDASYPMNSLMSRVFDNDMSIAHNHNNFCCFAAQAPYLKKVHFPHGFDTPWVKNWSSIFVNSTNLEEVLNIDCAARNAKNIGSMFQGCTALKNTDFRINGHCVYEATSIFSGCTNLEVDVLKLLPNNGFADQYVSIGSAFKDCKKLYIGTTSTNKVAQMLWCNNLVQWISTSGCFAGCSPELRSVVPKSWGGTAKDIISSTAKGATVINNYPTYPNRVNGPFNVALGIDNEVGFKSAGSSYSVAIGTSNKAEKQHSYAWGSQLNALSENSVTVGYGLTANDKQSTVIGFGNRSIADRTFANYAAMTNFFSQGECTNEVFVGYGVLCENGPGCSHIVDEVFEEPDTTTGMYVTLRSGPYDIEVGKRRWYYGKSHGVGTTTIVAIGDSVNDYGLANVYINDRSLANWTGVNVGQPTDKEVYNKGIFGPETSHCDHDYTIAIGDNAKAVETASSCQAVAIGRDALSAGSATVAVGPNSFAIGAQAVAVGWRANAVGAHSVAIGCAKKSGEDYYKDGTINTNSDLCVAEGSESVAIGFNAKARATGSVQIGTGTNNVPNTLKFQDITLVEGGKIVGSFDPKELDPRIHHFGTNVNPTADEIYVNCRPHVINTVTFDKPVDGGSEMYLVPEGSRNYKVFLPNRANLREGLPIALETEIDSKPTVLFNEGNKWCFKLPVMIDVKQPIEDTIIFENKHLEDSWDWTPGITNCAIICTNVTTAAKFVTQGSYSLKGTNLHAAVAFQLVYPTTATTTLTNNLAEVSAKDGFITGTLYYSAPSIELIPPQPIHFEGDTSWFEIIYKTTHGDAQVIRKTINVLD